MDLNNEFKETFQRFNFELHPDSPVPIYYQLSRYFEKLIQDEVFKPDDRFPSEESIANYFLVSRPTANKAMQILLNEGWLTRDKQNKRSGTFVKEKPYFCISFLTEGMSFADQFTPDVPIKSQIVWTKSVPATGKVAKLLHLNKGDPIIHIRRLRFACDQPIMVCDSQLSEARFEGITKGDFVQDSLYKTLEVRYNCPIVSSERQATAIEVVDPEIIRLLGVNPFSSILMLTGVSFTHEDNPVDYLETYLQPGVSLKNRVYRSISKD
jgi:GntR family transcriptional regulator